MTGGRHCIILNLTFQPSRGLTTIDANGNGVNTPWIKLLHYHMETLLAKLSPFPIPCPVIRQICPRQI